MPPFSLTFHRAARKSALIAAIPLVLIGIVIARAQAEDGPTTSAPRATDLATAFTYQGRVAQDGVPIDGTCDFRFAVFAAPTGGVQLITTVQQLDVPVNGGLFTTTVDLGSAVLQGEDRYLETSLRCPAGAGDFVALAERQALTPTPYSIRSLSTTNDQVGGPGSGWSLTGNAGTTPGTNFIGTTDNVALELRVNGVRALRLEPNATSANIIAGFPGNSLTGGLVGVTIGGGANNVASGDFSTIAGGDGNSAAIRATVAGGFSNAATFDSASIGGGYDNTVSAESGTIAGGWLNTVTGDAAFVGGGYGNSAGAADSTVSGGFLNTASGPYATVGGGARNAAQGTYSTVAGGGPSDPNNPNSSNRASDDYGTVGGGARNLAGNGDGATGNAVYATVGGGEGNRADGYATVGGGQNNTAGGVASTVAGGSANSAGFYATVGGGFGNVASAEDSTIGGGSNNVASANESTVGGGVANTASAKNATVAGGESNDASGISSVIGGGYDNTASAADSTVSGGASNIAGWERATVGGGFSNEATNDSATVGGGYDNAAPGDSATVAGGWLNVASGTASAVGGGFNNQATKDRSVIAGGSDNLINVDGEDATIGGGYNNTVTADSATVAGGWNNTASGPAAFVGGGYGNTASGLDAMVVGGFSNTASGDYSFASGRRAKAVHFGSFVWGDGTDVDVSSPGNNTFSVRASGGIWLGTTSAPSIVGGHFIDTSTGAYLTTGGQFTNASDVNLKTNFRAIDTKDVLAKLVALPVTTWNYKAEGSDVLRMGPMAQDFYAAFGLGDSDKAIGTVDAQGVAFAAIQGLYETVQDENADLRAENAALESRVARLESAAGFRAETSSSVPSVGWLSLLVATVVAGVVVLRKVK